MPLQSPFSLEQFLAAVGPATALPQNETREHEKPRASGLASCARQQGYMMAGAVQDEIGAEGSARASDGELTAEQGRHMEDLTVKIIEAMRFEIVDRQVTLPADYPVSGHPDGRLAIDSIDRLREARIDERLLKDGLVWGWENKHLGRWGYENVLKNGLFKAEPGYVLQSAMYGDALGWDASLFTIMAQDSSSVRGDMTANLRAKNPAVRWAVYPDLHPKVTIVPVDLRPLKQGLVPMGINRAQWLTEWKKNDGDPGHIAREADPETLESKWIADGNGGRTEVERPKFPCSYCPYLTACLAAGSGGKTAPSLPWITAEGGSE